MHTSIELNEDLFDNLENEEKFKIQDVLERNETLLNKDKWRVKKLMSRSAPFLSTSSVYLNQQSLYKDQTPACPMCGFALPSDSESLEDKCCNCGVVSTCRRCMRSYQRDTKSICFICYQKILYEAQSGQWFLQNKFNHRSYNWFDRLKNQTMLGKLTGGGNKSKSPKKEKKSTSASESLDDDPRTPVLSEDFQHDHTELGEISSYDNQGAQKSDVVAEEDNNRTIENESLKDEVFLNDNISISTRKSRDNSHHEEIMESEILPDENGEEKVIHVDSKKESIQEEVNDEIQGVVEFSLEYDSKENSLTVHVRRCLGIKAGCKDRRSSDTYMIMFLLPDNTPSGRRHSAPINDSLNPQFNEKFKFFIEECELSTRVLHIAFWHYSGASNHDVFLGEIRYPMDFVNLKDHSVRSIELQEESPPLSTWPELMYKGEVDLALKYSPASSTKTIMNIEQFCNDGELTVWVKEARNLMTLNENGSCSPFLKIIFLPDYSSSGNMKSHVLRNNPNPRWNSVFRLPDNGSQGAMQERGIEITIWDQVMCCRTRLLGGLRLNMGRASDLSEMWMDSTGLEYKLWNMALKHPNTWVEGTLLLRHQSEF